MEENGKDTRRGRREWQKIERCGEIPREHFPHGNDDSLKCLQYTSEVNYNYKYTVLFHIFSEKLWQMLTNFDKVSGL